VLMAHARVRRQTARAYYQLGTLFLNGTGVALDLRKAIEAFEVAAALGMGQAQNSLAMMCAAGDGAARDNKKAQRLYSLAASQGVVSAQYNLGIMLAKGYGSAVDHEGALNRWLAAASSGHLGAHYNVGVCFEKGRGMAKPDLMRAVAHYTFAAEKGHRDAMFNLAFLVGHGVPGQFPPSPSLAQHYYLRAAAAGDAEAFDRYTAIRKAELKRVRATRKQVEKSASFWDWGLEKEAMRAMAPMGYRR